MVPLYDMHIALYKLAVFKVRSSKGQPLLYLLWDCIDPVARIYAVDSMFNNYKLYVLGIRIY